MSDPAELYYGRRRPRPALQAVVKSSLPGREPIDLGLDKKLKQRRVEQARPRLLPDDVERPLDRHGALIGAIGRGQGVENVRDDHHLGLNGKLFALPTARVAGAVELPVVGTHDARNLLQLLGPRDLAEKARAVVHVRLDLFALVVVQGAAWDGEQPQLVRHEERPRSLEAFAAGRAADLGELAGSFGAKTAGLVGGDNRLQEPVQPL